MSDQFARPRPTTPPCSALQPCPSTCPCLALPFLSRRRAAHGVLTLPHFAGGFLTSLNPLGAALVNLERR